MLSSPVLCLAIFDLGQKRGPVFIMASIHQASLWHSLLLVLHLPQTALMLNPAASRASYKEGGSGLAWAHLQKCKRDIRWPWCKEDSWNESRSLKKITSNKEILSQHGHNLSTGAMPLEIRHNNPFNICTRGSPEN